MLKYPLLVGFLVGVGLTMLMAVAWAMIYSFYRGLRRMLEDS